MKSQSVKYGDEITHDKVCLGLVNNLIVYFERHGRKLTDVIVSKRSLESLINEAQFRESEFVHKTNFYNMVDGSYISCVVWGINIRSNHISSYDGDEGTEIRHRESDDRYVHAYDWTDISDPWHIELELGGDK